MKRGSEETSSYSPAPTHSRARFSAHNGEDHSAEDDNTKQLARKVAEHYSARTNQTLEEREASPIIHMKKLNNWSRAHPQKEKQQCLVWSQTVALYMGILGSRTS
eukprot:Gb_41172 [translate_table: standard]